MPSAVDAEQFASRSYVLALKQAERDQAIACARQAALGQARNQALTLTFRTTVLRAMRA